MADLIDRDALKKHVCDMCDDGQRECKGDESCAILCWINDMPAITRWISVEDDLPEKDKSYFTYAETTKYCTHNEIPEGYRRNILYFNGEEWYDEECRYYNVLFWMPLPDPPEKEVSDEKK